MLRLMPRDSNPEWEGPRNSVRVNGHLINVHFEGLVP
jgi:hypothetical protein